MCKDITFDRDCKDRSEGCVICCTSSVGVALKRCPSSAVASRYLFCEVEKGEDSQEGDPQRLLIV